MLVWRRIKSVGLVLLVLGLGCKHTWQSEGAQPNLFLGTDPATRESTELVITLADMHLPRIARLKNTASFVVVTRDRIRARVRFLHRWEEMTDVGRWKAWLEDESGQPIYPSAIEKRATRFVSQLVLPELYFGKPTGFVYRYPVSLYDGGGDYVFYREDLYRETLRRLTLVLQRSDYEFRYTWHFARGRPVASEVSAAPRIARVDSQQSAVPQR